MKIAKRAINVRQHSRSTHKSAIVTGLADQLDRIDGDAPGSHPFPYLLRTLVDATGDIGIKRPTLEGMFVNMLVVGLFL